MFHSIEELLQINNSLYAKKLIFPKLQPECNVKYHEFHSPLDSSEYHMYCIHCSSGVSREKLAWWNSSLFMLVLDPETCCDIETREPSLPCYWTYTWEKMDPYLFQEHQLKVKGTEIFGIWTQLTYFIFQVNYHYIIQSKIFTWQYGKVENLPFEVVYYLSKGIFNSVLDHLSMEYFHSQNKAKLPYLRNACFMFGSLTDHIY